MVDYKKYQSLKIRAFFIDLTLTFAYLLIFQFSGFSHATKTYVSNLTGERSLIILGYMIAFGIIYYIITFPVKFYLRFILEHKYSLSNQTFLNWLSDEVKSTTISSAIAVIFIELFYLLVRVSPDHWWLWIALAWFLFSIFFAKIFPVLILPLFYKCKAIDDPALKQGLVDLAKNNGLEVMDVFQMDFSRKTKKANAALMGMGRTRRIVLADNLIERYNSREIQTVLAHEIGHYKYLHIWKLLLFGAGLSLISFYIIFLLTGSIVSDIEAFPEICFILTAFSFMTMPVYNGFSRRLERAADGFALKATHDKEGFISCMKKLAEQNLSDPSPARLTEFLFYDHPPISKRIRFAKGEF